VDALLCEACGYPIGGVPAEGSCPECGEAVALSLPDRRDGPAWERSMSVTGWLATGWSVVRRPGSTFRRLRVGGSALRARVYLGTIAACCLANPVTAIGLVTGDPRWLAAGLLAAKGVVALTYLEALGLVVIGRQRGWRLPLAHAERVVAYASTGWLGGLAVAWGLAAVLRPSVSGLALVMPGLGTTMLDAAMSLVAVGVGFTLIALPFEGLAYLGSRRCRFANGG